MENLQAALTSARALTPDAVVGLGAKAGASLLQTAERGLARIRELGRQCGMPRVLRELGVPAEAIPRLAQAAMKVTRLLKNNLRELTAADAEANYHAAYQ